MEIYHRPEDAAAGEPYVPRTEKRKKIEGQWELVETASPTYIEAASEEWEERRAVGVIEPWPGCYVLAGANGDIYAVATTAAELMPWLAEYTAALDAEQLGTTGEAE